MRNRLKEKTPAPEKEGVFQQSEMPLARHLFFDSLRLQT
jgi:hypothetical protein